MGDQLLIDPPTGVKYEATGVADKVCPNANKLSWAINSSDSPTGVKYEATGVAERSAKLANFHVMYMPPYYMAAEHEHRWLGELN